MKNRPRQKTKKRNLKQVAFTRFMLVVAVFVLWIGGISVRLVHLQVTQHAWLKGQAINNRQDLKKIRTMRGTIYDRNDRVLAMSVRVKTLYANPVEIADADAAVRSIGKIIKIDERKLTEEIKAGKEKGRQFITIAKKLDEDTVQKINKTLETASIRKADLPAFAGLHWVDDQKRSYPYQGLAAQTIGFSDASDDGKAGIEQSQDGVLHGSSVDKLEQRDRLGRIYDETVSGSEIPGDVVLTIDYATQYIVEQALERGVKNADARSGMAIAMVPKTGEILALANYPTFDPNSIGGSPQENQINKAIQSVYSPGSVFKIVTYGSALERKLFAPDDMIDAGNGTIEVANHKFTDSHAVGRVSYSQALAHSSNVCAIKTGLSVGRDDFYALLKGMGFGNRTGVELPAETVGIVRSPDKWNGDSLASMSIGYEIGVTALQMTSAFATIANDGVRIQPHIIKEIRKQDEQTAPGVKPDQVQVVSAETARSLRTMLKQVVLTGTGRRAQLNGYTAAGKTGTAWKFDARSKSVDASKYVSSFIGMAPADKPEIVIAVVMDEPKVAARDGGMVSAPVFREIAQQLLQAMKVAPDAAFKQETLLAKESSEVERESPPDRGAAPRTTDDKGTTPKPGDTAKDKPKAATPKKTNDKKFGDSGKLTAWLRQRAAIRDLKIAGKTKLET